MPQNLRKLCRRGRRSVVLSLLIGLPVVLIALLAVLGSLLDAPDAPACQPDVDYPADSYLAIRPEYASNLLESQNGRDYYLLFWWDDNGDLCARIVCGGTQLDAALTDLQYYTYGLDEQPPQQLVVRGMTAPLPDGIQEAAIREYNRLVEDGDASPESFTTLFGSYCLDVTRAPIDVPYVVGVGALALLALVWMLAAGAARRRIRRQNDRTLAHTPPAPTLLRWPCILPTAASVSCHGCTPRRWCCSSWRRSPTLCRMPAPPRAAPSMPPPSVGRSIDRLRPCPQGGLKNGGPHGLSAAPGFSCARCAEGLPPAGPLPVKGRYCLLQAAHRLCPAGGGPQDRKTHTKSQIGRYATWKTGKAASLEISSRLKEALTSRSKSGKPAGCLFFRPPVLPAYIRRQW